MSFGFSALGLPVLGDIISHHFLSHIIYATQKVKHFFCFFGTTHRSLPTESPCLTDKKSDARGIALLDILICEITYQDES